MDHSLAIEIFNEIRQRPYRVSEEINVPVDNCYFKGIELLQRLGALGYTVRGRIGETYWDDRLIPPAIVALYPREFPVSHFYVEAEIDGQWRKLDPSFEPALAKFGFNVADWSGTNAPCFPITKLYTLEEAIAYQKIWQSPGYAMSYFSQCAEFLGQFNAWIASLGDRHELANSTKASDL